MIRILNESTKISVPFWVADLESFRRWSDIEEFPDQGRIDYLNGEVWLDMSTEQVFTHGAVKTEYTVVLGQLAKDNNQGMYWVDGPRLSHEQVDLSVKPDGIYVAIKSLQTKRVRLIEGVEGGIVEIEGSPDMVIEIVSSSSVEKDTEFLRQAYWEAGILEYWLVDARKQPVSFDILHRAARGYVATPKMKGWIKSRVFGKSFKFVQQEGLLGHPAYRLNVSER